jgi:hypothetical protein
MRPQHLEGGAVVVFQRGRPLQHIIHKGRARIGAGLLDQPVEWIADVLSRVDRGAMRYSCSTEMSVLLIVRSPRCGSRSPSADR